ncbi:hypothetical protein GGI07_004377 [Coemansia sp. Benny D115]|nr:hypothetical protein GGI07_004377 [Coemansia sp. Benny D115]
MSFRKTTKRIILLLALAGSMAYYATRSYTTKAHLIPSPVNIPVAAIHQQHANITRRAETADLKSFKAKEPTLFVQREFEAGAEPKRMIFIGDIHGSVKEFNMLLEKAQFTPGADQVVLVGDLVAKGPESVAVVRRARQINAWGTRGNHDDRVIRWREFLDGPAAGIPQETLKSMGSSDMPYDDFEVVEGAHYDIARKLSPKDYEYLASFPTIMALPDPFALWVVVHGGLDASKPIMSQNAEDVMITRNIGSSGPTKETDEGSAWFELWGEKMQGLTAPAGDSVQNDFTTVEYNKIIYGHDASRALQIHDYTKGLDSRCVYGGELTAFILPGEEMVSVTCPNYDGKSSSNDRRRRRGMYTAKQRIRR